MKKIRIWSMLILSLMMMPLTTACGGDDDGGSDGDGSNGNVVDGVNVNTKKLKEITIIDYKDGNSQTTTLNYHFNITYDPKGRLSTVTLSDYTYYDNNSGVEKTTSVEMLKIDYDLHVAQINEVYRQASQMFTLNSKGYIAQIGKCTCSYDYDGYLTRVESNNEIWSLVYNDGDLLKSAVSKLAKGNIKMYYFFSGEDTNTGELYFRMNTPDNLVHNDNFTQSILSFIAYQSGLFGKISKFCTSLSKSNQSNAAFTKASESSSHQIVIHCSFKY